MGRLAGKVALVTGAASGFGEAIARRFAAEGANVVVADLNGSGARNVAEQIGPAAVGLEVDVTRYQDAQDMISMARTKFGGIDIVVNNAGVTHVNGPMLDVDEDTFDRIFSVNVKAIYLMALAAVPALRMRGGGVILNTASTAALRPRPGLTWYNGSKGAAVTITKSMAVELAPDNIRVNALCPVMSPTGMIEQFMGAPDTPENRARFVSTIPLGRFSTPADIANAALYLASDEGAFITGVAFEIDGGRCI